jgi:shikimate kinase
MSLVSIAYAGAWDNSEKSAAGIEFATRNTNDRIFQRGTRCRLDSSVRLRP